MEMNSRAAFEESLFANLLVMPLSGASVDHIPHLGGASACLRARLHAVLSASLAVCTLLLVWGCLVSGWLMKSEFGGMVQLFN